ncbi:hypothetical protein [Pleionea sediminis]|uniref:hypothetical protein n=1 Tax=Pleionea sediminis TaxID=2569479 RepID=UPI0011860E46|nr:hypothetical protein [Pleionea sediminis]
MSESDLNLYLVARKNQTKIKAFYCAMATYALVVVALVSFGIIENSEPHLYTLACVVLVSIILDFVPIGKPSTSDLLDIIEKQINNDPKLIEKLANKKS